MTLSAILLIVVVWYSDGSVQATTAIAAGRTQCVEAGYDITQKLLDVKEVAGATFGCTEIAVEPDPKA